MAIFGSFVREGQKRRSDIDMAVEIVRKAFSI
jgi:predicted nucleotidyltransferase